MTILRCTGTTSKRSNNRHKGRSMDLHDWRRQRARRSKKSLHISFSFSTSAVLCIKNSSPYRRTKPSIESSTVAFWSVWRKRLDLRSTKNSILHSDNTPCHRALLARVFLAKKHVDISSSPIFARLSTCNILFLPQDENVAERSPFSRSKANHRSSNRLRKTTSMSDSKSGRNAESGISLLGWLFRRKLY